MRKKPLPDYWTPDYLLAVDAEIIDDKTTLYCLRVRSTAIVAGPYVRAACERHLSDLANGRERGLQWDLAAAQRIIGYCRHVLTVAVEERDGETGEVRNVIIPFILELWQAFIFGALFGWKNRGGLRRFRRAYVETAKGNGKSPMASALGHYMLTAQRKIDAEVYSAASALDQAEIAFRHAVAMWEMSPALRRRLVASGEKKVRQLSFINPRTKRPSGFFKPISSEKKGKSGPKVYCALVDEVHEHVDNSVIEMMRAGTKGNQEALIFEITNSGFDKKTVCGQEHDTSVKIVTGEQSNDAWFVFIASLDEKDEPFEDESCWPKANPNLNVSIHPDYIREQVQEAKVLPSKEGIVRRLNFCQWTGSEKDAIPRELWMRSEIEVDPDEMLALGYRCFGGLDLSRTTDLTALTLTWLPVEIKDAWEFISKTWFFTPADTLRERARKDRAPYEIWVKEGYLEAVPGKILKFGWLADAFLELCSRYHPEKIGADDYGLKQLVEKLEEMGQTLPCVVHPQGFRPRVVGDRPEMEGTGAEQITLWMPDSINKLENALIEERIKVDRNPVMRMCSQGVVYTMNRTSHRMFDKNKATTRIDGMVSLAMSIGVATMDAETSTSVFDQMAKEDGAAPDAQGDEAAADGMTREEEATILANPRHPRWQEVREIFEARLQANDRELD